MRIWLCLLGTALLSGEMNTPHIAAAASAYEAGRNAAHSKKQQEAIDLFRKAIEIEPTFEEAYRSLIDANLELHHRDQAAAAITQLLEINPAENQYRLLLGRILAEQDQTERALAQFSLILNRDPFNAEALLGFAAAAKKMGMNDRAAEALERGRQRYPRDLRFRAEADAGK